MTARVFADRPALGDVEGWLSYRELDLRAARLATFLEAGGIGRGDRVGVCLARGAPMLVALLGILKAGAAYVPLDAACPTERLKRMLEDAAPATVIVDPAGRAAVPDAPRLDLDDHAWLETTPIETRPPLDGEDPAYVIFTSGSTGRPKGVEIPHRAVLNLLDSMRVEPGLGAEDLLLAVTTLSFDISVLELFLPLLVGGRVFIAPDDERLDPMALRRRLESLVPTVVQATPTTWRMLLDVGFRGHPTLRVLCGGEPLSAALAGRLRAISAELWNMYGPTETTIWSTLHQVTSEDDPVPIGRPIANTWICLLDEDGEPVGESARGEICIGGQGVALGYLGRPTLTAERFVKVSSGPLAGRPFYRTGDIGSCDGDGVLRIHGRLDDQLKIRGVRIEPADVEGILSRHPDVRACVVGRVERLGEGELIAWIATGRAPLDEPALRALARQELPDAMVPHRFVPVDAFPLTANGKIDRRALALSAPPPQAPPRQGPPPLSAAPAMGLPAVEESVLELWRRALGRPEVGPDDDFFESGGHSLLAVRLLASIHERLGRLLPLPAFLEAPTARGLASLVVAADEPELPPLLPLQPHGDPPPLFLACSLIGGAPVDLARQLGHAWPVYALQPVGLDGRERPLERIEEMASRYVAAIVAHQPEGPCFVGGYSFGAWVALEVAQQLVASGREVALVVVIDESVEDRAHFSPRAQVRRFINLPFRIARRLVEVAAHAPRRGALQAVRRRAARVFRRYALLGGGAAESDQEVEEILDQISGFSALPALQRALSVVNFRAMDRYRPRPYPGPILLVRGSEGFSAGFASPDLGWRDVSPRVMVHRLDGCRHNEIMVGRVAEVGAAIRRHVDEARRARGLEAGPG
jgi:amino acid adenylation domain-containing protein